MAQRDRVLNYIQSNGSITALQAMQDLGVIDLAGRIRDLRRSGVNVASTPMVVKNRFGEKCHIVRYEL